MLKKLHAKLGDFWWYSIMLFCACRAADVLNAAVGLWLVPKYVGPAELGAVIPLTSFAGFLTLPIAIFATVFSKEVTTLATYGEYGKIKSLMQGAFIGAGIFLALALMATHFVFPAFLERIRVTGGSLSILILASSFIGTIAPIYASALQALKRFKSISLINIISAPLRFIVMLIAMPFRALSGYFVGQATTPMFIIISSVWFLRKELSVPAEPYWSRPVFKRFSVLFLGTAAFSISGAILGLVEQTVLRQRLPDLDSAAYYMATRFSDIAGLIACTLATVLFPFTANLAAEGKPTKVLVLKSSIAMIIMGGGLALLFVFMGKPLLSILPDGDKYSNYSWSIPWLIGIATCGGVQLFHTNTEISAGRFGFLKWWVPLHLIGAGGLLFVTGYGYFSEYLPVSWCDILSAHNITSLKSMLIWFTIITVIRFSISTWEVLHQGDNLATRKA